MKETLKAGDRVTFEYVVPANKTVPDLYPDQPEFAGMPTVFATGFMVGLMELTCMKVLAPHLEEGEGSLGIHIDVSHTAATVPGQTVTVEAECTEASTRKAKFHVKAHDGFDLIGEGTHDRAIVQWAWFDAMVNKKAKAAEQAPISRRIG